MRFSRKCFDSITYMTMTTTREEISDKQTIISFERERERERERLYKGKREGRKRKRRKSNKDETYGGRKGE